MRRAGRALLSLLPPSRAAAAPFRPLRAPRRLRRLRHGGQCDLSSLGLSDSRLRVPFVCSERYSWRKREGERETERGGGEEREFPRMFDTASTLNNPPANGRLRRRASGGGGWRTRTPSPRRRGRRRAGRRGRGRRRRRWRCGRSWWRGCCATAPRPASRLGRWKEAPPTPPPPPDVPSHTQPTRCHSVNFRVAVLPSRGMSRRPPRDVVFAICAARLAFSRRIVAAVVRPESIAAPAIRLKHPPLRGPPTLRPRDALMPVRLLRGLWLCWLLFRAWVRSLELLR